MRPEKPKNQRVKIVEKKQTYHEWVDKNAHHDEFGEAQESNQANPDNLSEGYAEQVQRGPNSTRCLKILDRAVQNLTGQQKKAYVGYYRDGKTEAEIADDLGISQQNVSGLLHRALTSIQEFCDEEGATWTE